MLLEIRPVLGRLSAESVDLPGDQRISKIRFRPSDGDSWKVGYLITPSGQKVLPHGHDEEYGLRQEEDIHLSPEAALIAARVPSPASPTAVVKAGGDAGWASVLETLEGEFVNQTYIGGFTWRVHCYLHGVDLSGRR